MQRVFTMRRSCRECGTWYTINGSNHRYCGFADCTRRRRRKDRQRLKAAAAGSEQHLAQALRTGE